MGTTGQRSRGISSSRQAAAGQPTGHVEKTTVVTDVAVLADSNIRKEEKIEKYQMLKAQLEKVKSKVVTGALRAERVVPTDL